MNMNYELTNKNAHNKRHVNLGTIPGLAEKFGPEFGIRIFQKANFARHFELQVQKGIKNKLFKIPIYLSLGTEYTSAVISEILPGWDIFGQHRGHSLFLNLGGDPRKLRDELLGLPTGCSGGMSGSNAIQSPENKMWGHSGLMGEQVPVAVGAALATGEPCISICGDASVEEDYIYPSLGFASTRKLPVLFICEDNDLSILTKVNVRRNWSPVDVATGVGVKGIDIADDPWTLAYHLQELKTQLPAMINIRCVRVLWHAGDGNDGPPEWDRYQIVSEQLMSMGLKTQMEKIDSDNKRKAEEIWAEVQPKQ